MSNWINDDIQLDDIPYDIVLQNTIKEAEELDAEKNTEYFCVADALDVLAKQLYAAKKITKEQWDRICQKYPSD